ncbi:hypothetical protein [Micromonospora sp. DT231]|uniref:hypothetical protein n=1 Tax=Micromonospora sp. DT231 TaxID=3416526 RepID=UPI003CE98D2F
MTIPLDDPVIGAYRVSTPRLKAINDEAWLNKWTGRWSDETTLATAVEARGEHVIVPALLNSDSPRSYRCHLWYLVAGRNERRCTLVDVSATTLETLPRMTGHDLEGLVALLVSELPLTSKA